MFASRQTSVSRTEKAIIGEGHSDCNTLDEIESELLRSNTDTRKELNVDRRGQTSRQTS
mgnify:CR=1 FL=1